MEVHLRHYSGTRMESTCKPSQYYSVSLGSTSRMKGEHLPLNKVRSVDDTQLSHLLYLLYDVTVHVIQSVSKTSYLAEDSTALSVKKTRVFLNLHYEVCKLSKFSPIHLQNNVPKNGK
jgi:hypothetical protein